MKIAFASTVAFSVISLVGCSRDGDSDEPLTVNYVGFSESVVMDNQTNQLFAATFSKLSREVEVDLVKEITTGVFTEPDVPSCIVIQGGLVPLPSYGVSFDSISAGEYLILTSSMSTFAQIEREEHGSSSYQYIKDLSLIPDNTSLSIPGDEFPSFDVPWPYIPPLLTSFQTKDMLVNLDAEITWTAHTDSDSAIRLRFVDDIGSAGVSCLSRDSGSFVFPQHVTDYFGLEEPLTMHSFLREKLSYHYKDDAMLITFSRSSPFF